MVKRGRGRPPKSETEIPHTNLVRTNQMFLPLKKRHKMVEDYNTGGMFISAFIGYMVLLLAFQFQMIAFIGL